jgi:SAM-dependent methyltransferase
MASLARSFLLPIHLFREYKQSRRPLPPQERSPFDQDCGVETDGDLDGWTHLSDLDIPSQNWIHGNNYAPIEPDRFRAILQTLPIRFEDFVFVDFGSGKGRALLLCSEAPFKRIVGVEFSPQLHAVAQRNIAKYSPLQRKCAAVESVCMDFLQFPLPLEPSVLFFFDPCDEGLLAKMLARISQSLRAHPREAYLIYVAPPESKERLLDTESFLVKLARNAEHNFCIYKLEPALGRSDQV